MGRSVIVSHSILLVDDSPIVVESVLRWLKRDGYQVVVASNCAEVRAIAAGRRFAVHIFDLELSDGHGIDLALWLRGEGHSAQTIFYTGYSLGSASLERARHFGYVVTKGENPTALLRVLAALLDPAHRDERGTETRPWDTSDPNEPEPAKNQPDDAHETSICTRVLGASWLPPR